MTRIFAVGNRLGIHLPASIINRGPEAAFAYLVLCGLGPYRQIVEAEARISANVPQHPTLSPRSTLEFYQASGQLGDASWVEYIDDLVHAGYVRPLPAERWEAAEESEEEAESEVETVSSTVAPESEEGGSSGDETEP